MKDVKISSLLAVHPMHHLGEKLLRKQWPEFFQTLRNLLMQVGMEAADSSDQLLLLDYDEPYAALTSFFESLTALKKQRWKAEWGPVPLQIIFHLQRRKDPPAEFRDATSSLWNALPPEIPHVTRPLKLQWEQLVAGKKLPAHQFRDMDAGLFQLNFSGDVSQIRREKLFAGRYLAARGKFKECFYCGMTNHVPANCPSKLLTMETRGIHLVGYLPLPQIDALFQKIMAEFKKMQEALAAGLDPGMIRKDPALQVFLAYFDIYLIYQPRFLAYTAFSIHPGWDGSGKLDRVKVDSRTLHSGLDCLRVGKHKEAFDLLTAESQAMGGKQFYATIGQAFVSMERGRLSDMAQFLQMAGSMAGTEKEKIYVSLLLARFHSLSGHAWKAEQLVQSVASLYADCQEVLYRIIQNQAGEGAGQNAVQLIRKLAGSDRRYFMATLMDPALLPMSSLVENVLSSVLETKNKEARENFSLAQTEYADLAVWFGEEDDDLAANLKALAHLEEQVARKSFYDLLDVAEKAKALTMASPRLREAKLDLLNEQVDEAAIRWADFSRYWQEYSYQPFFRDFLTTLTAAKRKFVEARSIAGENLATAKARLDQGLSLLDTLKKMSEGMQRLKLALDTLKTFLKKLLVAELVFSVIAFVSLPVITLLLADSLDPELVRLVKDPRIQKNCMFVINMLLAPLFALALTIRSMTEG
ncbi:hypothetical protein ACUUL3_05510 [Thiovibrio sp. JS02]